MSGSDHYINSFVVLRNNKIWRNGQGIFENEQIPEDFLKTAYETLDNQYPKFYKMDVLGKLGIITAHLLLEESNIKEKYASHEVGIVLSNRNSSIEADVNYYETAKTFPSPALFVYTLPNIVIGEISIRYKFKGENAFFISDTFNADWLYFYVNTLLENEKLKCCICGWVESMNGQHDVCMFVVEKHSKQNAITFTADNLKKNYEERRSEAEAQ